MDVVTALRNSNKGRLKYDRYWVEEGRTKEVLDNIASRLNELNISPKALAIIQSENHVETEAEKQKSKIELSPTKSKVKPSKEACETPDFYFFQLQSEMNTPILEYEECRLKSVQDTFEAKKKEYENYSKEIMQQIDQQYNLLKRKNELDEKRKAVTLHKAEEEYLQKVKEKELQQKEHYRSQAKKLSAKVREAEEKQKKAEEEQRKREEEQKELLAQLLNCQKEAENMIQLSVQKLSFCENPNYLNVSVNERNCQLSKLLLDITSFVNQTKADAISIDDILNANFLVKQAYDLLQEIINDIENAKVKAQNECEKLHFKQQIQKETVTNNKGLFTDHIPKILGASDSENVILSGNLAKMEEQSSFKDSSNKTVVTLKESSKTIEAKSLLSSFIAPDAVEGYVKIKEAFKEFETLIQSFIDDVRNKKCRFELQKKVNTPINKIFSGSKSHVKSQINQLLSLLSDKTVEINRRMVPFKEDSLLFSYCLNIVAKQLVTHGEVEIASHGAYAFPFAAAVTAVWAEHLKMTPLLLGHFYTRCPYLVPYYPPRQEDQSEEDYYKSMGYKSSTEDLTSFLKRMGGYMRLYAAIIVSPVHRGNHPHGLSHGWRWLSRTLNFDPRPHVTATLLYEFLYIAGYSLQQAYGKQFKKLLHVLCKDYFLKIKSVMDPSETKTPVERLEQFLQMTIKKGCISRPEGILSSDFWKR